MGENFKKTKSICYRDYRKPFSVLHLFGGKVAASRGLDSILLAEFLGVTEHVLIFSIQAAFGEIASFLPLFGTLRRFQGFNVSENAATGRHCIWPPGGLSNNLPFIVSRSKASFGHDIGNVVEGRLRNVAVFPRTSARTVAVVHRHTGVFYQEVFHLGHRNLGPGPACSKTRRWG